MTDPLDPDYRRGETLYVYIFQYTFQVNQTKKVAIYAHSEAEAREKYDKIFKPSRTEEMADRVKLIERKPW